MLHSSIIINEKTFWKPCKLQLFGERVLSVRFYFYIAGLRSLSQGSFVKFQCSIPLAVVYVLKVLTF